MNEEHAIRLSQAGEPYEPDPKLSPWKAAAVWGATIIFSCGALYAAGLCLQMAWRALQ